MEDKLEILKKQLKPERTKVNEPLAGYTQLGIGGPADILYTAVDVNDLVNTVKIAKLQNIPVTVLGRGSNILISDRGIRGLVIRNESKNIKIGGERPVQQGKVQVRYRWESDDNSGTFRGIEFKDLDYDESDQPRIDVTMDSGVDLPFAIKYTLDNSITGLQWYAGIPGTIGGAVYNNIHGGTHFMSEILSELTILDNSLETKTLKIDELGADYDKTRFHDTNEIILKAKFNLFKGDTEKAKFVATEWMKRKKIQPRNSSGCAFANITQGQKKSNDFPTTSIGYIVEHELNMTGFRIGDAAISPDHHNFIVNKGKATAKDYLAVMKEIHKRTKEELGIELVPEIILLGFEEEEIAELTTKEQDDLRKVRNKEIKTVYK